MIYSKYKDTLLTISIMLFSLPFLAQNSTDILDKTYIYTNNSYNKKKVDLPIELNRAIKPIKEIEDAKLQVALEKEIYKNKTWSRLIRSNQMSVAIVDLNDSTSFKYAGINDNFMMYAASLPKIAILLAVMDAIDKGELEYTTELKNDLRLMISKSNNRASTRNIDRVGYKKIEEVLRAPKHKLYDEEVGGGLWVGKRYASAGKRYPDPIKGLSHAATTRQVCSFYYQLALGNLISTERSKEMLEIMKTPELHHKFVNTLDRIAPKADVYRKSGSWRNYHSDSALVWGPNRKYIIVALIHDTYGEQTIRDLVIPLEKVLKNSRSL
ncbi:class A beta-lactamase-related serine hydrolase [Polaribacter vadi]|uniref:serine hydrolase n=1 Tax=Polaribacter TaxID=52959 RepID=UPI001C09A1B1|nr:MULTISPECIES: serine hydrolase [Polaribacter]MBU3010089.1 class A beta-lactamase-related serine hydrolase [Polaribacter vadi]MDO6739896.1 serine hydrolase [Polaribacter sp. 1_MG-2023]